MSNLFKLRQSLYFVPLATAILYTTVHIYVLSITNSVKNYDYSHHSFRAHIVHLTIVTDNLSGISCI